MKLILTNEQEFLLETFSVSANEKDKDSVQRVEMVFDKTVTFDSVAAVSRELFGSITISSTAVEKTYTGYAYENLTEHITEDADRLTLVLKK